MNLDCTADLEDVSACLVEMEKDYISEICDALQAEGDVAVLRLCAIDRWNRGLRSVAGSLHFCLDGRVSDIDIVPDVGITASNSPHPAFLAYIYNLVDFVTASSLRQDLDDFIVEGEGTVEPGLSTAGDRALGCHVGQDHFDEFPLASVAMPAGLRGIGETSEYQRNRSTELVEEKVRLFGCLSHQQLKLEQADAHVTRSWCGCCSRWWGF